MDMIKVTQVKSLIAQNSKNRRIMKALGLKRIGAVKVFKDNNCIRGMVNKVVHLVNYELVKEDKG